MKALSHIKHIIQVIWIYKIEIILEKFFYLFLKNKPLKNIIIIESHNDFDCNGGAFYEYLLKHRYNQKYKIVWLIRKKIPHKLPDNVTTVPLYGPSFKKAYYMNRFKYMTYDSECGRKMRNDQIVAYCSHGAGGLKAVKGKQYVPESTNYILTLSPKYTPIQAEQWSLDKNDPRFISIGYPSQDLLFKKSNELQKITKKKYDKVLLWMPTFRKGIAYNRNDSTKEQPFGLPLIQTLDDYSKINELLKKHNSLLIIKIHPKQDLKSLTLPDASNIRILTGDKVKELNIDNYRLMPCVDALISDYSGAAYDYLQLDRPIAYVLDDMDSYKNGFVVQDIHSLIAGQEVYNINDLEKFINDVANNQDPYKNKRRKIRNYIHEYHDQNASKRLAKLLKI